jgi:hypothetical protein
MLNEIPYEPDKPLPQVPRRTIGRGVAALVLVLSGGALSGYFVRDLWREAISPYLDQGPVIEVNYGLLASPGFLVCMIASTILIGTVLIGYMMRWRRRTIDRYQRIVFPAMWLSLVIMIALPVIAGPRIGSNVIAADYLRCQSLEFDGVFPERTYVKHPFLCVEKERLPDQLTLYDKLAQAQREGRLREALKREGLAINRQGHIVSAPGAER